MSGHKTPPARNASDGAFPPSNGAPSSSIVSTHSSGSSSYRHHHASLMIQTTPDPPKPVLMEDASHSPKTRGSLGILIVGLGGANGGTLLAGVLANRHALSWRGPKGEMRKANYNGCITQLNQKGGGVGYKDKIKGLAEFSYAAVGGWDIRPTKLGDALLDAQILDYDLVRKVQEEMNKMRVFKGYYDERFIGSSQHETATHVLTQQEASEALKYLRADIRYFKWRNGVVGHTTVVWSASVEPNCELPYDTARDLLDAIEMPERERKRPIPPSLLYATAALLEGCSFVNGGSQNTLSCRGLTDLAQQQHGCYLLGTDFKAGQTKFKTAAVEYIRTMGLTPKVIASSNHLGNNDMKNLQSQDAASKAKLRVKHDIFAPWQEDIDHKVSIMYTPYMNDDKRDFVEYTSLGFLDQEHTMVTYTRASDSVLCVPLMIDAAVWCDFFARKSWPFQKVAKALAYLFKVPEGAAQGVDPGFFHQMRVLDSQAHAASESKMTKPGKNGNSAKRRVRIRPEEKTTEWAIPQDASIICAGLACVDMQLNQASGGGGGEGIETFEGSKSIGGGSVSMACKTLARMCHGAPLDDDFMQVTPPVVKSVVPLCKIGNDDSGDKLLSLLESCGNASRNVNTKYIREARSKDTSARTALAVLPIYKDGRRGCFFDAASNDSFSPYEMLELIDSLTSGMSGPDLDRSELSFEEEEQYQEKMNSMTPAYGAFLFGYPHLLPKMQGDGLVSILEEARYHMLDGGIVALDLNGVPEASFKTSGGLRTVSDLKNDPVIGPALEHVDILHMNEDELTLLTGCEIGGTDESELEDEYNISRAVNLFLLCGVAVVAVTRGKRGSFVSCNDEKRFSQSKMLPSSWVDCTAKISAAELPPNTIINTNGAGDSFTSGLLVASLLRHTGMKIPTPKNEQPTPKHRTEQRMDFHAVSPQRPTPRTSPKKSTPYQLYMKENYVSLKKQLKDDKKAIFTKCHEMWENESEEVKAMYERRAEDDFAAQESEASFRLVNEMDTRGSLATKESSESDHDEEITNKYMTNKALNLESAVLFASLVAFHHIDISTRDLDHIDVIRLLDRSVIFPHGLQEI